MDHDLVENVAASLVREYLCRKGLRNTLQVMDEEAPRGLDAISNRMQLMKAIHIEKLMKKNKDLEAPYKSMLEVISNYFIEKAAGRMDTLERPKSGRSSTESSGRNSTDLVDTASQDRPTSGRSRTSRSRSSKGVGDLVLEDTADGENLLGEGKTSFISSVQDTDSMMQYSSGSRPKSSKMRGMSGPITSNLNDHDRRRLNMSRPKLNRPAGSSLHKSRVDPISSDSSSSSSGPVLDSALNIGVSRKTIHTRDSSHELHLSGNLPSRTDSSPKSRRRTDGSQIEDVLDVDMDTRRPGSSRLERQSGKQFPQSLDTYSVQKSSLTSDTPPRKGLMDILKADSKHTSTPAVPSKQASAMTRVGDLEIGEVDDLENDLNDVELSPKAPLNMKLPTPAIPTCTSVQSKPIDIQTAVALKELIFGSATENFNDEWRNQSFTFCDLPRLQYGIIQKKTYNSQYSSLIGLRQLVYYNVHLDLCLLYGGMRLYQHNISANIQVNQTKLGTQGGPCGVLSSVQACMLQELLFSNEKKPLPQNLEPSHNQRSDCLAAALTKVFWRARNTARAIVTLPGHQTHIPGSSRFKTDGLTEKLNMYSFTRYEELLKFIKQQISQFEQDGSRGVALALYSVILSRSIERIREDMDEPRGKLMGAHGYCTQDMVNLFLTGRAVANVFNDVMELDSGGNGPNTILRGVTGRSDIGLLSLFEHFKSCKVGSNLKTPRHPIWVVCSESHFSVLFSLKKELLNDWKAERRFDLYYYDGLARQEEEIRLTIDTTNRFYEAPGDDELVPPIDLCIRTKWPDAEVDWNGTEPLL